MFSLIFSTKDSESHPSLQLLYTGAASLSQLLNRWKQGKSNHPEKSCNDGQWEKQTEECRPTPWHSLTPIPSAKLAFSTFPNVSVIWPLTKTLGDPEWQMNCKSLIHPHLRQSHQPVGLHQWQASTPHYVAAVLPFHAHHCVTMRCIWWKGC